jgi:hypothetical protein
MIGVSNTSGTLEITKNEYELILAIRELLPNDKLIIQKKAPTNKVELFVRIERGVFLERG